MDKYGNTHERDWASCLYDKGSLAHACSERDLWPPDICNMRLEGIKDCELYKNAVKASGLCNVSQI
jgi:hypothetical protein